MTTGIYKLTFPSGKFYIGKSTDIAKRWKQHADSFSNGKHTKNMQAEYNKYRSYNQEVLYTCHEDHIDILEETIIARQKPPLNGNSGRDRLVNSDVNLSWFNMSTLDHIAEIERLSKVKPKVMSNSELAIKYKDLSDVCDKMSSTINELYAYKRQPWWQKIFS